MRHGAVSGKALVAGVSAKANTSTKKSPSNAGWG
jgi:hypothetical protein